MYSGTYPYFRVVVPQLCGFSPSIAEYLGDTLIRKYHHEIHAKLERYREYLSFRRGEAKDFLTAGKKDIPPVQKSGLTPVKYKELVILREKEIENLKKKALHQLLEKFKIYYPETQNILEDQISKKSPWVGEYRIYELVDYLFYYNQGDILPTSSFSNPMFVVASLGRHHDLIAIIAMETLTKGDGTFIDYFFTKNKEAILEKQKQLYSLYKCTRVMGSIGKNGEVKGCPEDICEIQFPGSPEGEPGKAECTAKDCKDNSTAYRAFAAGVDRFQKLLKACLQESFPSPKGKVPWYLFGMILMIYWNLILPKVSNDQEEYTNQYLNLYKTYGFPEPLESYPDLVMRIDENLGAVNDISFPIHTQTVAIFKDIPEGYANCMESMLNTFFNMIVIDKNKSFKTIDKRVRSMHPRLREYYNRLDAYLESGRKMKDIPLNQNFTGMFADIVSDIPGAIYKKKTSSGNREIMASWKNLLLCVEHLLPIGGRITRMKDLEKLSFGDQEVSIEVLKETENSVSIKVICKKEETEEGFIETFVMDTDIHAYVANENIGSGERFIPDTFYIICGFIRGSRVNDRQIECSLIESLISISQHYGFFEEKKIPKLMYPVKEIIMEKFSQLGKEFFLNSHIYTDLISNLTLTECDQSMLQKIGNFHNLRKIYINFMKLPKGERMKFPNFPNAEIVYYGNLPGIIDKSVWKCPICTQLDLKGNIVEIPDGISNLGNLTNLAIASREDIVKFPDDFALCPRLKVLDLEFVKFLPGKLDLSKFTDLYQVKIDSKEYIPGTFKIPNASIISIGIIESSPVKQIDWNGGNVERFDVSDAVSYSPKEDVSFENARSLRFSGILPDSDNVVLPNLTSLEILKYSGKIGNKLLESLPKLNTLIIDSDDVIRIGKSFESLIHLKRIDISGNVILDGAFPEIAKLRCFSGNIKDSSGKFPKANVRRLELNSSTSTFGKNFMESTKIEDISIERFLGKIPINLFSNFENLLTLKLNGTSELIQKSTDSITKCKKLVYLQLYSTENYSLKNTFNLSDLKSLHTLIFRERNVTIEGISFCPLTYVELSELNKIPKGLENCPLNGLKITNSENEKLEIPANILAIRSLRTLELIGQGIISIEDGFSESNLIELSILNTSALEFPMSILKMTKLNKLTIRDNSFTIPQEAMGFIANMEDNRVDTDRE